MRTIYYTGLRSGTSAAAQVGIYSNTISTKLVW